MNYTIDQGNTHTKGASFDHDHLSETFIWKTDHDVIKYFEQIQGASIIICSVSGNPQSLNDIIGQQNKITILDHQTSLPIMSFYESPETLGMDRIAVACGASYLYPNETCLIVDMGTCITYELIDSAKNYHGGAISPGFKMRFSAMHNQTKRLPLISDAIEEGLIGKSTNGSMVSGVLNGITSEIEGFILRFKEQFGELKVILTGGDSHRFESKIKAPTFVAPNLVHIGLNSILRHNEGSA
ncbi:MAG: type III pantothenate kinase [Bacteroidetes bacterium]|nr:type III pantothenate kinase [Bacteroidota bacterium]MDA1118909.1 type III pantothenate kinase [Bacteroidota bacterium]